MIPVPVAVGKNIRNVVENNSKGYKRLSFIALLVKKERLTDEY